MDTKHLEYNVIVLKWGDKFTPEHVNRIYRMAKRNLTLPFNFYCYTENSKGIYDEINIVPLDESLDLKAWWWKLTLFKENSLPNGINLFLDLDVVIQNNIDHLFEKTEHNKLTLIDNFTFTDDPNSYFNMYPGGYPPAHRPYYNSSIMVWYNNENKDFFNTFIENYKVFTKLYHGIDGFLSHEICPSRFSNIGDENYYFRTKIRVGEVIPQKYNLKIKSPTEKYPVKGRVVLNFNQDIPVCIFNGCHENIFYRGMEKYLL